MPEARLTQPCGAVRGRWTAGVGRLRLTAISCGLLLLLLLLLRLSQQSQPQLLMRHQLPRDTDTPVTPFTPKSDRSQAASSQNPASPTPSSRAGPALPTGISAPAGYVPVPGGCLPDPVISTHSEGGRLGNTMAEYASILALGLRYNISAVMPRSLLYLMRPAFLNLTLPVVFEYCLLDDERVTAEMFEEVPDEQKHAHSWEIVNYAHRISLFWQYREILRREFTFRRGLLAGAQQQLRTVAGNRTDLTFVGVHVRRADYGRHLWAVLGGYMLNESFYQGAMELCRYRYHQPVFIVTSDDLNWCRERLSGPDVYVVGDPRRVSPGVERDMALMAACNHSIFDYGTFGFFGAFLAGGDLILADGYAEREHEIVRELRIGGINATFLDPEGNVLSRCRLCTTE